MLNEPGVDSVSEAQSQVPHKDRLETELGSVKGPIEDLMPARRKAT